MILIVSANACSHTPLNHIIPRRLKVTRILDSRTQHTQDNNRLMPRFQANRRIKGILKVSNPGPDRDVFEITVFGSVNK